jgi:hypothetical protein
MTIERKFIVGIEDIRALVFECNSCHSRLSVQPGHLTVPTIPLQCPQCQERWSLPDPFRRDRVASPFASFVESIELLRSIKPEAMEAAGFKMLLELEEPRVP